MTYGFERVAHGVYVVDVHEHDAAVRVILNALHTRALCAVSQRAAPRPAIHNVCGAKCKNKAKKRRKVTNAQQQVQVMGQQIGVYEIVLLMGLVVVMAMCECTDTDTPSHTNTTRRHAHTDKQTNKRTNHKNTSR